MTDSLEVDEVMLFGRDWLVTLEGLEEGSIAVVDRSRITTETPSTMAGSREKNPRGIVFTGAFARNEVCDVIVVPGSPTFSRWLINMSEDRPILVAVVAGNESRGTGISIDPLEVGMGDRGRDVKYCEERSLEGDRVCLFKK